jgi:hypothetical protein
LNKEKFLTVSAPRCGKAGATVARGFSYDNRRRALFGMTLLSNNHKHVIAALLAAVIGIGRQLFSLDGGLASFVQFRERH